MSKFKAKDLTYDKSQPEFLQRLRAEFGGDRNNVQFARPSKSRLQIGGEVDEDEPTIVDENGEGVSKEEYDRMVKEDGPDAANDQDKGEKDGDSRQQQEAEEEKRAAGKVEFGNVRRRKALVGKVIGSGSGSGPGSGSDGAEGEEDGRAGDRDDGDVDDDGDSTGKRRPQSKGIKADSDIKAAATGDADGQASPQLPKIKKQLKAKGSKKIKLSFDD